jgi:mannose-6-phosphate isomerase-like protein (cupin superfamily)
MIRREDAVHHVWGDPEAGYVTDRVLSSTRRLHVLEYELPPGGEFRHSDSNRTIFGADVVYLVVAGQMIIADPSSGEMHILETGEGVLMRAGTWHNAFNPYRETTRVIEYFCPPPALGAASDFARRQPPLVESRYKDARWEGCWPAARAEAEASRRLTRVSFENGLLEFRDDKATHLRSLLTSTEFLQVLSGEIQPGHVEEFAPVSHESVVIATEGELWVDVWTPEGGYAATNVLRPGDAMFLPAGSHERMLVRSAETARYVVGRGTVPDGWTTDDL